MFEKYFVTCPVAVALKEAGFDEPCIAARECYEGSDGIVDVLHVSYLDSPTNPDLNSHIAQLLCNRPALLELGKRRNSEFPPWLYAAPLYQQVFEWFEHKGLYLHPYYVSPAVIGNEGMYGCNIYDRKDNSLLWPLFPLSQMIQNHFADKRDAVEQAILAAIKLLSNEPEANV